MVEAMKIHIRSFVPVSFASGLIAIFVSLDLPQHFSYAR